MKLINLFKLWCSYLQAVPHVGIPIQVRTIKRPLTSNEELDAIRKEDGKVYLVEDLESETPYHRHINMYDHEWRYKPTIDVKNRFVTTLL